MSGRRRPTGRVDYTPTTTPTKVPLAPEPPLPGRQLTTEQTLALSSILGFLEGTIDLAERTSARPATHARGLYRRTVEAFPDLAAIPNLIEEKYLS